jgi:hypothetical protein
MEDFTILSGVCSALDSIGPVVDYCCDIAVG